MTGLRRRISGSQAARAGLCFAALIVVAEGAVLLLAPSEEGIPPEARRGERLLRRRRVGARCRLPGRPAPSPRGRPRRAGTGGRRARRGAPPRGARFPCSPSSRSVLGTAAAGVLVVVVAEAACLSDDARGSRALRGRRAVDPVARAVAWRPGQGPCDRRDHRGGGRRRSLGADPPLTSRLVDSRLGRRRRLRRRDEPARADPDRTPVQRLRRAAAGQRPPRERGRIWASGPGWTWARSTGSTPAAAARRSTPT